MSPSGVRQRSLQRQQCLARPRPAYELANHQELCVARQCFWACSAWSFLPSGFCDWVCLNIESFMSSLQGRQTIAIYCCAPGFEGDTLLPPCIQTMTGNDWLDDVAGVQTFKYRQSSSIRLLSGSRSPSRLLWTQRGPHSEMLRMPFHGCTG